MAHKEVYLLPRPLKAIPHQYQHPEKEVHLLSGPSELQPVNEGVTQYTPKRKDQDLLQPPDASEAQKLRSPTQIQQPRQEYSRFTEKEKAKFQTPSTDNDDRNFVQHNSVEKFSPDLVHPTKSDTSSVSDSIFSERREEITEDIPAPAEDIPAPAPAEDVPAPAEDIPVPAPAPAPTLETVEE